MKFLSAKSKYERINKVFLPILVLLIIFVNFSFFSVKEIRAQKQPSGLDVISTIGQITNPLGATASTIGKATKNVVVGEIEKVIFDAIGAVSWFVFSIFTVILSFVGWVYDIAVFSITQYTTMPIVTLGWKISLGITNVFFSIAMVIIAFATIMNQQTYGIKALLPKLILMAILINFSLPIAGVIIDASQIFMYWFINSIKGTNNDGDEIFAIKIANSLQIGANIFQSEKFKEGVSTVNAKDFAMLLIAVQNITLGSLFLIGVILAFIAGIVLIFVRAVVLWTLLITAPLAWFSYIIPSYSKYYSEWWSNFINQCVIGPVYFFFIWVAMKAATSGAIKAMTGSASIGTGAGIISGKGFQEFAGLTAQFTMQYWILLGIMWAGVIIAPKIGGAAGAQASGLANYMKKGLTSMASKGAKWAGNTAAQNALRSQTGQGIIGGRLGKIPFLGTKLQEAAQKAQELQSDPYKNLSGKMALSKFNDAGVALNSNQQAAIFKAMTEKGGKDASEFFDAIGPDKFSKMIQTTQKYDPKIAQNALKIRPDLHPVDPAGNSAITMAQARIFGPGSTLNESQKREEFNKLIDMSSMNGQGFANADVQALAAEGMKRGYVSSSNVLKFAENNPNKISDMRDLLRANASNLPPAFKQSLTNSSAAQILGVAPSSKDNMIRDEIRDNKNEIAQQTDQNIQHENNAKIDRELATQGHVSAEAKARAELTASVGGVAPPPFTPLQLDQKIEAIRNHEKQKIENKEAEEAIKGTAAGGLGSDAHKAIYDRHYANATSAGISVTDAKAQALERVKQQRINERRTKAQKEIAENRIKADATKAAAFNQTLW